MGIINQSSLDNDKRRIAVAFASMQAVFEYMTAKIWGNPEAAQAEFDKWGSDGAELCKLSNAYLALMKAYTGEDIPVIPDGYDLRVNEDGSVTVLKV